MLAVEWLDNNSAGIKICHFYIPVHSYETMCTKIGEAKMWESEKEKLQEI